MPNQITKLSASTNKQCAAIANALCKANKSDKVVLDSVYSDIILTEADFINLNETAYTAQSMEQTIDLAQEYISLGLMIGYDGHPKPVYDEQENVVGFDYSELEPAFVFRKLWYDSETKQGKATIEYFPTNSGKKLAALAQKQDLYFSLRAILDGCIEYEDYRVCKLGRVDGGDRVKNPAVPHAKTLKTYTVDSTNINTTTSIKCHPNCSKSCCANKKIILLLKQPVLNNLNNINNLSIGDNTNMMSLEQILGMAKGGYLDAEAIASFEIHLDWLNKMLQQLQTSPPSSANKPPNPTTPAATSDTTNNTNNEDPSNVTDANNDDKDKKDKADGKNSDTEDPDEEATMDSKKLAEALDMVGKIKTAIDANKTAAAPAKITTKTGTTPTVAKSPSSPVVDQNTSQLNTMLNKTLSAIDSLTKEVTQLKKNQAARDEQETKAKQATQARQAVSDSVKEIEKAGQIEGRRLVNYPETTLQTILEKARTKASVDEAKGSIINDLTVLDSARTASLKSGIVPGLFGNTVRAEVAQDEADRSWKPAADALDKAMDRLKQSKERDLLKRSTYATDSQKGFAEEVVGYIEKTPAFRRKLLKATGAALDEALLIDGGDLRNQEGVIARAILREFILFTEALQFAEVYGPDVAKQMGRMFKVPLEGYEPPRPGTTRRYYEVRANESVGEAKTTLRYQKIFTFMRAIGFRLPQELEWQLENGVVSYDSLAGLILHTSRDMANQTSRMIYDQFQYAADEQGAIKAPQEQVAVEQWFWSNNGNVVVKLDGKIGDIRLGANVYGACKLKTGYAGGAAYAGANAKHPRIVVVPHPDLSIDDDNMEDYKTLYPTRIVKVGNKEQIEGDFDQFLNIVPKVPGQKPTFAVHNEGFIGFTQDSGFAQDTRPTIDEYWYNDGSNYDEFDLGGNPNEPIEETYAGLIRLAMQISADMVSEPNLVEADTWMMHSQIARGAFAIADLFEQQKSPAGVEFLPDYGKGVKIGNIPGPIAAVQVNGGLYSGARRSFIYKASPVKYGLGLPMQMFGPYVGQFAPNGGGNTTIQPHDVRYMRILDCARRVYVKKVDGSFANHPIKQIRFVGKLRSVRAAS
jgi:hypothetical protein